MTEKSIQLNASPNRFLKFNKILIEVIVAVLLIVFLHTAISKLLAFSSFRIQMFQSPVFQKIPLLAAITGPSLEITAAALLIFRRTRMPGFILSFCLMAFFTWYVWYLMTTMPHLPCSCGGVVSWLNWPQHLALNIILTVLSLVGIFLLKYQNRPSARR